MVSLFKLKFKTHVIVKHVFRVKNAHSYVLFLHPIIQGDELCLNVIVKHVFKSKESTHVFLHLIVQDNELCLNVIVKHVFKSKVSTHMYFYIPLYKTMSFVLM